MEKFDCDILYFLFIECTGAFTFLNEYRICLVFIYLFFFFSAQFNIPYSILFVQVTLSLFSKFKIIVGPCHYLVFADMFFVPPKKILIAKLLRINNVVFYVRRLSESNRMNVRSSQKMLGVHR